MLDHFTKNFGMKKHNIIYETTHSAIVFSCAGFMMNHHKSFRWSPKSELFTPSPRWKQTYTNTNKIYDCLFDTSMTSHLGLHAYDLSSVWLSNAPKRIYNTSALFRSVLVFFLFFFKSFLPRSPGDSWGSWCFHIDFLWHLLLFEKVRKNDSDQTHSAICRVFRHRHWMVNAFTRPDRKPRVRATRAAEKKKQSCRMLCFFKTSMTDSRKKESRCWKFWVNLYDATSLNVIFL